MQTHMQPQMITSAKKERSLQDWKTLVDQLTNRVVGPDPVVPRSDAGRFATTADVSLLEVDAFSDERCPVCKGMGVIKHDLPLGHPDFGKLVPCPANCESRREAKRARAARLIEKHQTFFDEAHKDYTFDS